MARIAIFTDSGTGLSQEWIAEHGIHSVPLQVIFGDETYRDGIDLSLKEFFARLAAADPVPTTSAPSPTEWELGFRKAIEAGANGILVLPLSAKLSMSFSTANVAGESIDSVPFQVLDTRRAAMAQGFVVLEAARAAQRGGGMDEVVSAAQKAIEASGFIFAIDTLEYLHRGGRVPAVASIAGSLLKIHPIMALRDDGTVGIMTASRSMAGATKRIVAELEKRLQDRDLLEIAVMQGDAPEDADRLQRMVQDRLGITQTPTMRMTTAMGVHTGPGIVGLAYRAGDPKT